MRQIPNIHPFNRGGLRIIADESTFRGAPTHRYLIEGFDTSQNRSVRDGGFVPRFRDLTIIFNSDEAGFDDMPNGVTVDALLAVVEDHLESRLRGPSGTLNQQMAAEYIRNARELLEQEDRISQIQSSPSFNRFEQRTGTL